MRSTAGLKIPGAWIFLFTLSSAAIISTHAFSASKAKPELPIGEELQEPSTAPAAASAPAAAKKSAHGSDKPAPAANPTEEKTAPAAGANAQHGEEKDPYAALPQGHGEGKGPQTKGSSPADATHDNTPKGEELDPHAAPKAESHSGRLLEGKVPPAVPTQGSGFFWFAGVFVILAIAIFIFT